MKKHIFKRGVNVRLLHLWYVYRSTSKISGGFYMSGIPESSDCSVKEDMTFI